MKNVTQSRPTHLEADHIFPDELDEGTDPNIMVVGMTHSSLSAEMAAMIGTGKAVQFCRSCHEQHQAADACGAVLKSWHEGWRITCPVCCSPLSEGARPRSGDDTIRDTSPFSKNWDTAINGEKIINRHVNGGAKPLASPVAMMGLLLILSCRHADATVEVYRKSWLLNEIVPGFDAEALRVSPSISKGATAVVPLHLRIALLAGLAIAARDVVGTLRHLRPACRPFYLRRTRVYSAFRRWQADGSPRDGIMLNPDATGPAREERRVPSGWFAGATDPSFWLESYAPKQSRYGENWRSPDSERGVQLSF